MAPSPKKYLPTAKTRKSLPRLSLQLRSRNRFNVQNTDKKTRDLILVPLVEMLYNQKVSNVNNNLPPYAITNMYNTYKPLYPWLTKDMLKGRLKRLKKANIHTSDKPNDLQSAKAVTSATTNSQVNIDKSISYSTTNIPTHDPKGMPKSAKTTPSQTNHAHTTMTVNTPSSPTNNLSNFPNDTPTSAEAISPSITTNHTHITTSTPTLSSSNNNPGNNPADTPNTTVATLTPSRGRPVGTTHDNISLINKCIISAQAEITHLYHQELIKARQLGKPRVSKGTYKKIHDNIKVKRNLPNNFEFPYNNVKKKTATNDPS
jgi:hypothetical protein